MNELMIVFKGGNYIYHKTYIKEAKYALEKFRIVCETNHINIDNMDIVRVELRNKYGLTIDTVEVEYNEEEFEELEFI